jgi:HEAT repeat protein
VGEGIVMERKRLLAATWAALALSVIGPALVAQGAAPPASGGPTAAAPAADARQEKLTSLWENLLHYIRLAQHEAAASYGQALVEFNAKPTEIYGLSVATPGALGDLSRGRRLKGMKAIADKLLQSIEQGYKAVRSDPGQIKEAIGLLGGTTRQYIRGHDRLLVSGEYAVPHLLRTLDDAKTSVVLRERIMVVLPKIGREAVLPLAEALKTRNPRLRQVIANALALIEYSHATPALKDLYDQKGLQEQTRGILRAALAACNAGDSSVITKPTAQLYYHLAEKFYYRAESLLPDPRVSTANVWYWQSDLGGLILKPVPREIFCDIYAMRMARLALKHDPKLYPAVSLWLASNLKREADLPDGATDPTRKPGEPTASFYVLAAGAAYQQEVLARALRDKDWPVAIGAIEALGKTAGAKSLLDPVAGGAQPLVEGLTCSNRVVRYWAALSLATALPKKRFHGSELVLPILNEALRQTGKQTALVVAADPERRNALKDAARAAGYEVIDEADHAKGLDAARAAGGIDVAVFDRQPDALVGAAMIRRDPLMVTLPLLIAAQTERFQALAKADARVQLVSPAAAPDAVTAAVTAVVKATAGAPLTAEEATQWAVRAAEAVRLLGLTRNAIYDVSRGRAMLIAALGDPRKEVKTAAAKALATMSAPDAQRAIAEMAMDAAAAEDIRLEAFSALGESARRFGNSLTDKQAAGIVKLVTSGTGALRTAAAEILGALSLPSEKVKDLILETNAKD